MLRVLRGLNESESDVLIFIEEYVSYAGAAVLFVVSHRPLEALDYASLIVWGPLWSKGLSRVARMLGGSRCLLRDLSALDSENLARDSFELLLQQFRVGSTDVSHLLRRRRRLIEDSVHVLFLCHIA